MTGGFEGGERLLYDVTPTKSSQEKESPMNAFENTSSLNHSNPHGED